MTSDVGVEQVVGRPFVFHCSCGAAIETAEKTVICTECGETVRVLRRVATPHGTKYTLRISKHRFDANTQWLQPLGAWSLPPMHQTWRRHEEPDYDRLLRSLTAQPMERQPESPDHNQRCLHLGLLILLAPLWVPILVLALSPFLAPAPGNQNRPYHYETHDVRVIDSQGHVHTVTTKIRVDD